MSKKKKKKKMPWRGLCRVLEFAPNSVVTEEHTFGVDTMDFELGNAKSISNVCAFDFLQKQ
ncbi:hypothetical protein GIB67_006119 [Kingdonia uniflora]|uniref:Uncharacterized protein n=1 Tax=Kingdonia uniflora TaxID=39325 RepID=A0A7J7LPS6_9MAGN|nr:hypothetical protein GIB67_006119 [Kingdonia uniflora]